MKNKKKNLFIFNSLYSLLIYLLYQPQDQINATSFLTARKNAHKLDASLIDLRIYYAIPLKLSFTISKRIDSYILFLIKFFYFQIIKLYAFLFLPSKKNKTIYTHDYSIESSAIIGKNKYYLIEEGALNYTQKKPKYLLFNKLKNIQRFFFGEILTTPFSENEQIIEKIYTKNDKSNNNNINTKVINLKKLWEESSFEKKELILNIFKIHSDLKLSMMSVNNILFTQPLSEDSILTEKEKIDAYKKLIKIESEENIIIKTHPRENTNYKKYFPKSIIIDEPIPMELLSILGLKFKKAYTIFSSAAINLDYDIEIVQIPSGKNLPEEELFIKLIK